MNHSFDVDLATKYGINAAILLQNIYWWIRKNKANGRHYYDGYYWTYNSRNAFAELFPYLSERQIKTAMDKLITDGVIITGDYNTDKWKRPTWYALTEKGLALFQNVPNDYTEMSNRENKTVSSYTDISTDTINVDEERACEEKDNPFGYGQCETPRKDTVQQYAVNNLKPMGYRGMEELNSFVEDLNEDIVRHAIDNALDNGKYTWTYVRAILNNYADEGVKTVGEAKALDDKHKSKRQADKPQQVQQTKTADEMTQEEMDYAMRHGPFGKFY